MDERDLAILEDEHKGKLEDRWLYKELTPVEEIRLEHIREAKAQLKGLSSHAQSISTISLTYIIALENLLAEFKDVLEIADRDGMQFLKPRISNLLYKYERTVQK